jgi:hypothetical protein
MVHRNQIIACVVKQYGTGLYQSCVSLGKGNVICLSTHKDEESAEETVNRFLEAQREGRIKEPDDVSLFVKSMTGELAWAA